MQLYKTVVRIIMPLYKTVVRIIMPLYKPVVRIIMRLYKTVVRIFVVGIFVAFAEYIYVSQDSEQHYINGAVVSKGRVTLCDTLSYSLRVSKSPRLRTILSFRIHEECGYKFVQSLSWYLRNKEPIPSIYKHVFNNKEVRKYYDNLIGSK